MRSNLFEKMRFKILIYPRVHTRKINIFFRNIGKMSVFVSSNSLKTFKQFGIFFRKSFLKSCEF